MSYRLILKECLEIDYLLVLRASELSSPFKKLLKEKQA